jgi:hypothetical protein
MKNESLFSLADGIELLKVGKKIRKTSWPENSWIEYSVDENCIIRYDNFGMSVRVYTGVNLDDVAWDAGEKDWEEFLHL